MNPTKTKRVLRGALAALLAFAVVALAPGLAPYEAAAQVFSGEASVGAPGGVGAPAAALPGAAGVAAVPSAGTFAPALNSALAPSPAALIPGA
ncbi:MAG: hypothetical protein KGM24_04170, partial [Elusimicrobia bacterium]|nr:hypothetical protein [Elusimicrobiota bacterium]